jgi:hypothetical protein
MSRVKTTAPRRKSASKTKDLSLQEALDRVTDPALAEHLSVYFAELSRAQLAGDREMIREVNRGIAEALRGEPEGEIDEPLLPLRRKRIRKQRKAASR